MHLNADLHPNFFIYNFIKFYTNCSKHIFQAQTQSNMNHFHLLLTRMFCLIGSLVLTISSLSAQRSAETIKILAVGNSFSDDGVEYLDELARAAGIKLIIGNLYIGGCSLERHWNNVRNELPSYDYRKNVEGHQTNTPKTTLQQALQDEEWDYITVQQVSQNSGLYDTYYPYIDSLLTYLKAHARNPEVEFAIHQVWSYAWNSTHSGFANYDNNQLKMYRDIVETVDKVARKEKIRIIIPSGTAIQTGRNLMGDRMNRDGFHLGWGLGRYLAACTWFETFLGPVNGNSYRPEGVTPQEATIAQHIAHIAVLHPNEPGELQ